MSLISDALKAAQKEKRSRTSESVDRARRLLSAPAGVERGRGVPLGTGRAPVPRSVQLAIVALVVAVVGAGAVAYLAPSPDAVGLDGSRPPLAVREPEPGTGTGEIALAPEEEGAAEEATEVEAGAVEAGAGDGEGEGARVTAERQDPAPPEAETPSPARQRPAPRRSTAPGPFRTESAGADAPVAAETRPQPTATDAATTSPATLGAPVAPREERMQVAVQSQAGVAQLFAEAVAAHRRRDFRLALDLYQRALVVDPNNPELYNNLGTTYQALGELARARDAFQRALAINARYAAAWSNLGIVLSSLGDTEAAQSALAEALRLDPGNVGAKVNLANLHQASGRLPEARALLEEVVRAEPTQAEAQYALARLLEGMGDRAGAVRHYRHFLAHAGGRFPDLEPRVREHLARLEGGSDAR